MEKTLITISRQYGSDGTKVAQAWRTSWMYGIITEISCT